MATHLISIISDHLLPNYLFIKEMEGKYDDLLFVTTKHMQQAGIDSRLEKTLGLKTESVRRITVSEENLNDILEKLKIIQWPEGDKCIVNLTGGTKIMSIGCYDYFSKFDSSFYYIPVGKNKIANVLTSEEINLNHRINLVKYLSLYGLGAKCETELIYPPEHTKYLFARFKKSGFDRFRIPEIRDAHHLPNNKDKWYYGGVWFEEYVYQRIKEEQQLNDDMIWIGVKLFRENSGTFNDNEIDVMFVKDNELYVGECKVSLKAPMSSEAELLDRYMYKLAAVSKDFGIRVHPYIFTLHNGKSKLNMTQIEKRMNILGIRNIFFSKSFEQFTLEL